MLKIRFIVIGIIAVILIGKIYMKLHDKKMAKIMSYKRKLAKDMALKIFGTNERFVGMVEPPVILVWDGCNYDKPNFDFDTMETVNYFKIYKFINGRWQFYTRSDNKLIYTPLDIKNKYNCSMVYDYFFSNRYAEKIVPKV